MIPSSGTSAAHALQWLSEISSPATRSRSPGMYVWDRKPSTPPRA